MLAVLQDGSNDMVRVTSETVVFGASTTTLTRLYDERERPAGISLSDGYTQQYAYDSENRVSAVSNAHLAAHYAYEDGYQAGYTITLPNGNTLTRAVTRDPYRRHLITGVTNLFNGIVISAHAYTHDILGRVISRNGDTFGYNARSELTSALLHTNAYGYVTDPIGNRLLSSVNGTETSYTANNLNQYTGISTPNSSLPPPNSFDADGNMLTHGAFAFTWDAENRNTAVFSNSIPVVANTYNYRHRRVRKTTPDAVRHMVYDGWNLIQETVTPAVGLTTTNRYHWGVDLSGTLQGAGGVGGLLAAEVSGQLLFPLYDANGNVTECVDASGNVRAHYEYDAFGNITAMSGDLTHAFPFRFSTKYFDTETGLYYYGYRFYSPELGRWLNRDPLEEEGGANLYCFVKNASLSFVDNLGGTPNDPQGNSLWQEHQLLVEHHVWNCESFGGKGTSKEYFKQFNNMSFVHPLIPKEHRAILANNMVNRLGMDAAPDACWTASFVPFTLLVKSEEIHDASCPSRKRHVRNLKIRANVEGFAKHPTCCKTPSQKMELSGLVETLVTEVKLGCVR